MHGAAWREMERYDTVQHGRLPSYCVLPESITVSLLAELKEKGIGRYEKDKFDANKL